MPYVIDGVALRPGKPFRDSSGTQYSGTWLANTSDEEKAAAGITWVDPPEPYDPAFFYSPGQARELADSTDANGEVIKGLKTIWSDKQAQIACSMLLGTDWYAVRKAETSKAIPTNIKTYRAAVRTACDTRQAEIAAVTTTAELQALIKAAPQVLDSDGETLIDNPDAHLTPWPDPVR